MDEDIAFAEEFPSAWRESSKNRVYGLRDDEGRDEGFGFAVEKAGIQLMWIVLLGPRGGVCERVMMLRPGAPILVDGVIANDDWDASTERGGLYYEKGDLESKLMQEVRAVKGRERKLRVCSRLAQDLLVRLQAMFDQDFEVLIRRYERPVNPAPPAWQGGLPSLGARR